MADAPVETPTIASLHRRMVCQYPDVLAGKRKPNLDLAKRMHQRLGIDAGLILRMA